MLPGDYKIYKCPKCEYLMSVPTLISGNTFGGTSYSDGKLIAPMMPSYPDISKCTKCKTIFWLNEKHLFQEVHPLKMEYKWPEVKEARFLTVNDLFKAIEKGLAKQYGLSDESKRELELRIQIWWGYNDRMRNDRPMWRSEKDEARWEENCLRLSKLLEQSDVPNHKVMLADVKRNMGDFEGCVETINSIDDRRLKWLKEKFIEECGKGNRWVFEFE